MKITVSYFNFPLRPYTTTIQQRKETHHRRNSKKQVGNYATAPSPPPWAVFKASHGKRKMDRGGRKEGGGGGARDLRRPCGLQRAIVGRGWTLGRGHLLLRRS
jgi:hypothetical protein